MQSLAADPSTARVASLARAGLTIEQIADRLQIHRSSVYRRMRAARLPGQWAPLSSDERRRIRELLENDYSRRQVAVMVGRGLGTVARVGRSLQGRARHRRLRSPRRCPGCGHMIVLKPCLVCSTRTTACG